MDIERHPGMHAGLPGPDWGREWDEESATTAPTGFEERLAGLERQFPEREAHLLHFRPLAARVSALEDKIL